MKRGIFSVII